MMKKLKKIFVLTAMLLTTFAFGGTSLLAKEVNPTEVPEKTEISSITFDINDVWS